MDEETKKILSEILVAVRSLDKRVAQLEEGTVLSTVTPSQNNVTPGKRLSIKEFIIDRAPVNGVQMTMAIAYYLETHEGLASFNVTDLEVAFRAAKETPPTNINDKINMCVRNGHLMEEKEKKENKKAWVVTRSGEQYVKDKFGQKK